MKEGFEKCRIKNQQYEKASERRAFRGLHIDVSSRLLTIIGDRAGIARDGAALDEPAIEKSGEDPANSIDE